MILRSIDSTQLSDLLEYCRQLDNFQQSIGIPSNNRLDRFCIGFYQLSGAYSWRGTPCQAESWMSAAIHFMVVAEKSGIPLEEHIPADLQKLSSIGPDFQRLLAAGAEIIRQLFYAKQAKKTFRSSRYDYRVLEENLVYMTIACIKAVPAYYRSEAIFNATEILSKRV